MFRLGVGDHDADVFIAPGGGIATKDASPPPASAGREADPPHHAPVGESAAPGAFRVVSACYGAICPACAPKVNQSLLSADQYSREGCVRRDLDQCGISHRSCNDAMGQTEFRKIQIGAT
jgi:hypothetical protein